MENMPGNYANKINADKINAARTLKKIGASGGDILGKKAMRARNTLGSNLKADYVANNAISRGEAQASKNSTEPKFVGGQVNLQTGAPKPGVRGQDRLMGGSSNARK